MKLVYLGTPDISVPLLEALAQEFNITAVITRPDKPKGRSGKPVPSPISLSADKLGLKLIKPDKIDQSIIDMLKIDNPDLFVTFSYGSILKQEFINFTEYGGINIHPSLLPKYRGPSPIQAALFNGDKSSGISIQRIALKVDSGDILFQKEFEISDNDDYNTLERKISLESIRPVIDILTDINRYLSNAKIQDHNKATYCKIIKKEDALINWHSTTETINNMIRAFCNGPVPFSFVNNQKISFYKSLNYDNISQSYKLSSAVPGTVVEADHKEGILIKTGSGLLKILELQKEGKSKLDFKNFLNGYKDLKNKLFVMER